MVSSVLPKNESKNENIRPNTQYYDISGRFIFDRYLGELKTP